MKTTIRSALVLAAALLLLAGPLLAGAGPAAELAALEKARDASKLGYREKAAEFRPRFRAFIEKHPGTEEALTAKLWLLQQTWWQRAEGTMHEAAGNLVDEILAEYPESKQLATIVEYHYVLPPGRKAAIFTKIGELSPHRVVKAAALFGLAKLEKSRGRFERLAKEYDDVPWRLTTYGAIARAYLDPHPPETLEVGRPAPEIEGVDLDGNPMKLSNYRGKVVVLDFWGDW